MAAVDPSESPTQQKSPAEEGETSGEKAEAAESGCAFTDKAETTCGITAESPGGEQVATVSSDGACTASRSGVRVASGAGADKTTCNSRRDLTSAGNMAEAAGGEQRSAAEEMQTQQGNTKCGMLTLLMGVIVSFSLQASQVCSLHH